MTREEMRFEAAKAAMQGMAASGQQWSAKWAVEAADALLAELYRPVVPDGWISWEGGDCPVKSNDLVEVKLRDGHSCTRPAAALRWGRTGAGGDIVAYRVLT